MKRIFSCMAALLAAGLMHAEQIGQLNPYAYGVVPNLTGNPVEIAYKLNAPADSSFVVIYRDGVEVGLVPLADNTVGQHNAVVDKSQLTVEGQYTFGIRVHGTSNAAPVQLKNVDANGEERAVCYAFFHPKGVDIDTDPMSPYFGRILTDEGMEDTPDAGYHSSEDKDGIYAFDASFSPIYNGEHTAFRGNYNYSIRMTDGKTRAYTPYRIRISDDGRIFVSMQDDKASSLYELSPDLQTWTPIFNGTMTDGVMLDADGNYITGINCGLDVKGSGENLEIIMLNTNRSGMFDYNGKGQIIATYKLGTATSWTGPATTADTLANVVGANVIPVPGFCGVAWDDKEGYWYIGNRIDAVHQYGLVHVNAAGQVDYKIQETHADSVLFSLNDNGFNGGGNAHIINNVLFVGTGRSMTGVGHLMVFDITHGVNNVPILTRKYDMNLIGISTNLNDFAVDYANNLYVVGNSNEKIIPVALPYSGVVETPVAGSRTVKAPIVYEHLYEIGSNQGWKPSEAIEMTNRMKGDFQKTFEFTEDTTYFAFVAVKPNKLSNGNEDWELVKQNRFSPETNDLVVESYRTYDLYMKEEGAFKLAGAGRYTFTVSLDMMRVNIVKKDESAIDNTGSDAKVQKVYEDGRLYILRDGEKFTISGTKVE